jgi:hypothetical protein
VVTEKSPNLKKVLPIEVQEASRMPNRLVAYHHYNNRHREWRKNIVNCNRKTKNISR